MKLDLEDIELDRILTEAMRVVSSRAEDKGLELSAEIAPSCSSRPTVAR